jgi:hypothetical protein
MKRGMADDLTATGIINGTWFWQHSQPGLTAAPARPQISTLTAQVMLHSKLLQPDLKLGMLMLNLEQSPPQISSLHAKAGLSAPLTTILLLPVPIPVGGTSPLLLSAAADRSQYEISLRGEADLARLRSLLRALGLQSEVADGTGPARVDLRYAGPWAGFAAPVEMGSVKPELSPVIARRR